MVDGMRFKFTGAEMKSALERRAGEVAIELHKLKGLKIVGPAHQDEILKLETTQKAFEYLAEHVHDEYSLSVAEAKEIFIVQKVNWQKVVN